MGWRTVVVSKPSKLDLRLGYLVVRDVENTVRIFIPEISTLIIENITSSITTGLLNELVKQKVTVLFCDEKSNPTAELNALYGSHDCSMKVRNQLKRKQIDKELAWTSIVSQKIKMQAEVLKHFKIETYKMLIQYSEEIELNDASNREGHAAKVYFNSLFGKNFSRTDDNPINASLNYGYSVILGCFNREIVSNGYMTQLGLFHDNVFNKYNLGCDLMEPFRPLVDRYVKNNNPEKFDKEEKRGLLSILNSEILIDERKQTVLNGIKIYTKSILDSIENSDISGIKYYSYEL